MYLKFRFCHGNIECWISIWNYWVQQMGRMARPQVNAKWNIKRTKKNGTKNWNVKWCRFNHWISIEYLKLVYSSFFSQFVRTIWNWKTHLKNLVNDRMRSKLRASLYRKYGLVIYCLGFHYLHDEVYQLKIPSVYASLPFSIQRLTKHRFFHLITIIDIVLRCDHC